MKEHSHSIITAVVVGIISLLGYGLYGAIGMSMFYLGREHSQAEYRYMKLKGINRNSLKMSDTFKKEAWNYDSLVNDFLIPSLVGYCVYFSIGWN